MAKIQERIKTDYKAMEESRGMVQQCACCKIRYRSHEVQPLCSDCEETQTVVEEAPVVEEPSTVEQASEIVSTPKTPKPFVIKEEAHPFKPITCFRAYRMDGTPVYIGSERLEETERRLRSFEMVSTITVEYLNPPTPEQPTTTQETPRNDEMFHELYYAPVEEVQAPTTPETPMQSIHDLIIEKQSRRPGKPSQDIYALLLKEEQEEGPHNDGLLAAYIREAHEALEDLVLLINEDRLYRRVLSGETVHVQVTSTGKAFSIRTTPENNATGLPAYDILSPTGKVEKRGIILNKSELRNWMYGLVEVD